MTRPPKASPRQQQRAQRHDAINALLEPHALEAAVSVVGNQDPSEMSSSPVTGRTQTVDRAAQFIDPRKIVRVGPYIRHHMDAVAFEDLKASIRANGIQHAIAVRMVQVEEKPAFALVYGQRRLEAALALGLSEVPIRSKGTISDAESLRLQVIENEARDDPHPVDSALGVHTLSGHEPAQTTIAEMIGKSPSWVSTMLRAGAVLAAMPAESRQQLYRPDVTYRVLQELVTRSDGDTAWLSQALVALVAEPPVGAEASSEEEGHGPGGGTALAPARPGGRPRAGSLPMFEARLNRRGTKGEFRLQWDAKALQRTPLDTWMQMETGLEALVHDLATRTATTLRVPLPTEPLDPFALLDYVRRAVRPDAE